MSTVTTNAVRTIIGLQSASTDPAFLPIFQVISIKAVGNQNGGTVQRYRAVLSDGTHFVQGMLATQLNPLVQKEELTVNSLVQVTDFMNNNIQGRNVIILLKLELLNNPGARIGDPTDIEKAGASAMAASNNNNSAPAGPMYNRTNNATASTTATNKNNPYGTPAKPQSAGNNPYGGAGARSNNNNKNSTASITKTSSSPGGTPITSISQLNMYQNRWTIKARVVSKSDIRTWSNAKGEGSLFSIELLDSSDMDIRCTLFKEAVDKFYNYLNVGSIYTIAGGRLKVANLQYNTCKSQYEMTLDQNSEIHLQDDTGDIQEQSFELTKISQLEQVEQGKNVDVIGILQDVGDVQTLLSKKSGQELTKCDVTIVDETGTQIRLTLWGSTAMKAKTELQVEKVCAFRRARISDYGGKSLSGNGFFLEPNIPETVALQQWWASSQGGKNITVKSLSSAGGGGGKMDSFQDRKTIGDIKNLNLGYNNEKGDYLSFKAHISFLKKDKDGGAWYTACPNKEEPCRNRCKVTQTTDGNWQCDRCHGTYPTCSHKWIFSGTLADDTSTTWVSFFDEHATQLFGGASADDAFANFDNQDSYDGHFAKATHSEWIFRCRVKNEIVNDEPRVKTQVVRMDRVDYAVESKELLDAIQKMQQ
jgi:replication factor A1